MSISRVTYIGCYIQLPKIARKKEYTINVCPNKSCFSQVSSIIGNNVGKFCSTCGSEMVAQTVKRVENDYLALSDMDKKSEELNDDSVYWNDEFTYVDPEHYQGIIMSNKRTFLKNLDKEVLFNLSDLDMKEEIKRFETSLVENGALDFWLKHFNFTPEIKYGIVSFYQ